MHTQSMAIRESSALGDDPRAIRVTTATKTRILFVDDEPSVLSLMRVIVGQMAAEWEADFVDSGEAALARMAQQPFDVVISDMRMPGMTGAQLLNVVMQRYPRTVRIILSGYADLETVLKCVGAVHQYFHKPFSPLALRATLERIRGLNARIQSQEMQTLAARLVCPPSVPALYIEILQALQSPDASVQQITGLLSQDPAMTAKTLQLVNSAFFGFSRSTSKLAEAVQWLGVGVIRSLALAVPLFSAFDRKKCRGFAIERLWDHSLQTAVLARKIVLQHKQSENEAEQAFTAGLLHDIGKLILADNLPGEYANIIERARLEGRAWHEIENEVLHATHAHVGGYLLGLWSLPVGLVEAVAYHHSPRQAEDNAFGSLTAVHVANALQNLKSDASRSPKDGCLDEAYLVQLGLLDNVEVWQRELQQG